ncbi:MAG: hypothetical protein FWE70_03550, partial [Oscillospiraceae bacterium]|nr:hypothetical protein [Oscillospiraceae bacterium]
MMHTVKGTEPYPLRMDPFLREIMWGGSSLAEYGKSLPSGRLAESWELSVLPSGLSRVADGPLAGLSLREVLGADWARYMG